MNAFLVANTGLTHIKYTWATTLSYDYYTSPLKFDPRIFTGCARLQSLKLPSVADADSDSAQLTAFLTSAPSLHTLYVGLLNESNFDAVCVSYLPLLIL